MPGSSASSSSAGRDIAFSHTVLPTREDDALLDKAGPVTRKIRLAENALRQRVEFEALVSRISSLFVRLKSDELGAGIQEALQEIGPFVGVDYCHVCRIGDNGTMIYPLHQWAAGGKEAERVLFKEAALDDVIPWVAKRLRRLDGMAIYSSDALEPAAEVDQRTFRHYGIKSIIFVPMAVGGELIGYISLDSVRRYMNWTEDAISLLKIVAAIMADAVERKRTEDALRKENEFTRALLNTTGALFILLDSEGRVVRWNHAAEVVSGYTADEVRGRPVWEVFTPREEREAERRHFLELTPGAPSAAREGVLVTRDGERRVISWSINAFLPESGGEEIEYIIMSGIDVTDTKRLEAEVLNVAEREQSRFGHDLHDGLGQHLTGIEFMSQVLQQRLQEQGSPEAAGMEEITKLIRQAISQTRDLARGLSPVVLQSKGLAVALEDLAQSAGRRLGTHCVCRIGNPPPVTDNETAIHLYRIAQEAVANAVKHGRAARVVISLHQHPERGLELTIEDNGRGFPPQPSGTGGMGLRVMEYRAGIIGGTLRVARKPGRGVTVVCTVGRTTGATARG